MREGEELGIGELGSWDLEAFGEVWQEGGIGEGGERRCTNYD